MKAKLEFDLDNHDDVKAHYRATRSLDMALALWDINNLPFNEDIEDLDTYQKAIREIYEDHNIVMSELID